MESIAADTVLIDKTFNATAAEMWRAWTDPAMVKRWFGSDPNGTGLSAALDVKPGGNFEISFANSDGAKHTCFGIYIQVKPFSILSFSWEWKNEPGVKSFVTVELQG
ncbi:MAG TPA: SRPBCC domain-containing protein [Chitinophagaceae bacterium]|nr:SRPBCC domain-containing protein [Chitinophagaceae bacterium]